MYNARDKITPNHIALSKLGESSSVHAKVIIAIIASCFSTFHALIIGCILIKLITATIIIAASVAKGK
jgi:hypothetical protein